MNRRLIGMHARGESSCPPLGCHAARVRLARACLLALLVAVAAGGCSPSDSVYEGPAPSVSGSEEAREAAAAVVQDALTTEGAVVTGVSSREGTAAVVDIEVPSLSKISPADPYRVMAIMFDMESTNVGVEFSAVRANGTRYVDLYWWWETGRLHRVSGPLRSGGMTTIGAQVTTRGVAPDAIREIASGERPVPELDPPAALEEP